MPFRQDPAGESRESDVYCSLCFKDAKLCFEGNVHDFLSMCHKAMTLEHHIPSWRATFFCFMIRFAPRWKKDWKIITGIY